MGKKREFCDYVIKKLFSCFIFIFCHKCTELKNSIYLSRALMTKVSRQLGAKLHRFLCYGLEVVVSSSVHVQIILQDGTKT